MVHSPVILRQIKQIKFEWKLILGIVFDFDGNMKSEKISVQGGWNIAKTKSIVWYILQKKESTGELNIKMG